MKKDLTNLGHLRQTALEARGLIAEVAGAAAEAIDEVAAGLPLRRSATLTAAGWTGSAAPYSQTVAVAGVRADEAGQLVWPVPAAAGRALWVEAGVQCTAQGAGSLTFTAQAKPGAAIQLYVILQEVQG